MGYIMLVIILVPMLVGLSVGCPGAQPYPNRPIHLIIPSPAGGGGDIPGRLLADKLERILNTQIIPINKPGAASAMGLDYLARSKKDGYTLGYASDPAFSRVVNPETRHKNPINDFDLLGVHLFFPLAVAVQESSPWKTFGEFIDYAKKNPGKIRVSTVGIGSMIHYNIEIIQSLTGAQFTHIPMKGGEAVITAVLGGHVEATCDGISKITPHAEAGKMRILLISKKSSQWPNVPTMAELGYKAELFSVMFSVFGPAGLPEEVTRILVPAIEKAVKDPDAKAALEKQGYIVDYKSPSELKKIMESDYETALYLSDKLGIGRKDQ